MQKKLILSAAAVAVMGVASFAALTSNNQPRELSVLELANIDALTRGEVIDNAEPGSTQVCYGAITTKDGCFVRYCGTCTVIPGAAADSENNDSTSKSVCVVK